MKQHWEASEDGATPGTDPLEALRGLKVKAPPGFADRVMARLPARPDPSWRALWRRAWPADGGWLGPALAGACATALLFAGAGRFRAEPPPQAVIAHFELHAPDAQSVELVGDFTGWQASRIALRGPDGSGHWTADVELAPGQHEYIFLVNGRDWVTDALAEVRRPDGFGRENAIMNL